MQKYAEVSTPNLYSELCTPHSSCLFMTNTCKNLFAIQNNHPKIQNLAKMDGPKIQYMRQIYLEGYQTGTLPQPLQYEDLRSEAQRRISKEAFGYADGSASTEQTAKSNREAFNQWQIVPRMLADTDIGDCSMKTELFGHTYPTPFIISPIGVQQLYHENADRATAQAGQNLQIPYTHSSASSTKFEDISWSSMDGSSEEEKSGEGWWYQLYWPSDDQLTKSLLDRAKKAGFTKLVVTLDTFSLGWRPRDLQTTFNPFLMGKGIANVLSDPYFIETYCEEGKDPLGPKATKEDLFAACIQALNLLNPGISRKWSELKILRNLWGDQPIILKGIQSLLDANRAVEAGMDGIWVSNHGGRQVDGAISSLHCLSAIGRYIKGLPLYLTPGISTERSKKSEPSAIETDEERLLIRRRRPYLFFDSGVRCGADVMKALALGADAVAIGRPWLWGLSVNGQEGVENVFKALAADLELNMTLSGIQSTDQLNPNILVKLGQEPHL